MDLPIELLRTFVTVVETGSMLKASARLGVTQSALSLRISRLEKALDRKLFSREGARLALLPPGDLLLGHARRLLDFNDKTVAAMRAPQFDGAIRVGLSQDFAESLLSGVLARFAHLHPTASLDISVSNSADLLERLGSGDLDFIAAIASADHPGAVKRAPLMWIGARELAAEATLRLVLLEAPCRFRAVALQALEDAGRPYRIVLETSDLGALRAAVAAGLGLTCRTEMLGLGPLGRVAGLPPLPLVSCIVAHHPGAPPQIASLADLVRSAVASLEHPVSLRPMRRSRGEPRQRPAFQYE